MKSCRQCKKEFEKPINCSKKEWLKRLYCSHECGYKARNIGKTVKKCPTCNKEFTGAYASKRYCSYKCRPSDYWLGKKRDVEMVEKVRNQHLGKHYSPDTEFKRGCKTWNAGVEMPQISRDKHWNWKGGVTDINKKIRNSVEYNKWRKAVYARDYWTCQHCKIKQKFPVAHHMKTFKDYPELRFEVSNGLTLCRSCHKKLHNEIGISTQFGRVSDKLKFA